MIKVLPIFTLLTFLIFFSLHLLFPLPEKVDYSQIVTDKKGEMIHAFLTKDEKWRMEAALDDISPLLRKTIIQKEDKFFYYHSGVNPFAIARAFLNNIFHLKRTSGASTITMQVARALERKPRNYSNKLIEIFRAWQIEIKYNKNEILQLYCNLLPYGGNIEGVKAASLLYFKKDPDHLSLAEITALCIIPNRPSSLVPGKHNARIKIERDAWLNRFASEGIFTQKQIADALAEPIAVSRGKFPRMVPHLSVELKRSDNDMVRTFIDLNIQQKTETLVAGYTRSLKIKNISNAAVVVIDNVNHQVIAYVGSAGFHDTINDGQVNGVNAIRQPGSTLKPFVYGMSIDEGLITPKSLFADVSVSYNGYAPENYDRRLNGNVTMEYALEHSLNIPAVRALNQLGTDRFISTLASCNFQQIKKDHQKLGLSLILGGCGTNLFELSALYSSLANEGRYVRPSISTADLNSHEIPVMSTAAAFMINETLSKINRPDFPLNWQSTERMPKIAWKTGTSYGRRDAWSIGYNKRYTVGVWVGNFSGTSVPDLSGAMIATPLLFKIFNTIDYDSDADWFAPPADCDIRMVCSETGMIPGDHCKGKVTDYFVPTISSTAVCNNMKEEIVSANEQISYCRHCMPEAGYKKKLYKVISPEMQRWSDDHDIAYSKIPPHNNACEEIFRNGKPSIISPSAGFEYLISRKNPEPLQLQCRAGNDVSRIYWYIDNRFYKSGDAKTPVYFVPSEGPVKISCTDDKGRNRDVWITVRYVEL